MKWFLIAAYRNYYDGYISYNITLAKRTNTHIAFLAFLKKYGIYYEEN